jgi:hypothetical protein
MTLKKINLRPLFNSAPAVFIMSFVVGIGVVSASAIYSPGDTLNPSCLPTDPDCTVSVPNTVTNGNAIGDMLTWNGISWTSVATSTLGLGVSSSPSQWTSNASNIYYNTGNVGIGTTTPNQKLDVQGHLSVGSRGVSSHNSVSSATSSVLWVSERTNNITLTNIALETNLELITGANSSQAYVGNVNYVGTAADNIYNLTGAGRLIGSQNQAQHYGSGTVANAIGFISYALNKNAGTITNAYGGRFGIFNDGSGTITNGYGAYIKTPNNPSGTLTNSYGLYLEDQSTGTNPYAIYSVGGKNYFGGNVGIGSSSPSAKLSVVGDAYIGGNLTATGTLRIGSLSGLLWATDGVVTAVSTSSLGIIGTPSQWTTSSSNIYFNTGNIGLGTTTPFAKLSVVGDLSLSGGIYDSNLSRGTNGMVLRSTGTGIEWVSTSTLGISGGTSGSDSPWSVSGSNISYVDGAVGIGTDNPLGLFHVHTPIYASPNLATGGTITTSGIYTIHTFTSSGTFTANGAKNVEYLVVGGGGGGGSTNVGNGGGGGGGGVVAGSVSLSDQAYTVTVGNGGTTNSGATHATSGGNSVFVVTAVGGGGGGQFNYATPTAPYSGGSGGGGGQYNGVGAAGTVGQGYTGGNGGEWGAGGGGGAGSLGSNAYGANGREGGAGGNGTTSSITGTPVTYGGGGGGSSHGSASNGIPSGGTGGGGNGHYGAIAGTNGSSNTGGGGGGGGENVSGGNGGSGVVIIRYINDDSVDVGIESLVINSTTGNVGIGTTSPFARLSVVGDTYVSGNLTTNSTFKVGSLSGLLWATDGVVTAVSTSSLGISASANINSGTQGQVPFYNGSGNVLTATSSLFISQSGNVGIGMTTPLNTLVLSKGMANGSAVGIDFWSTPTNVSDTSTLNSGKIYSTFDAGTYSNARLTLAAPGGSGVWFDMLNVKNTGVGIGTTSPSAKLDVWGSFNVATSSTSTLYANTSTGYVGIGTSAPTTRLQVVGTKLSGTEMVARFDSSSQYAGFFLNNTTNRQAKITLGQNNIEKWSFGTDFYAQGADDFYVYDGTRTRNPLFITTDGEIRLGGTSGAGGSQALTVLLSGNVGIGATVPTAKLHVAGTMRNSSFGTGNLQSDASGNITVSSDERLKDIQSNFNRGLSDILDINPILYKWKGTTGYDTENTYAGFSAQNVKLSIPEAVGTDSSGMLTLSDRPILATLVNAMKELNTVVNTKVATTTQVFATTTVFQTIEAPEIDMAVVASTTANILASSDSFIGGLFDAFIKRLSNFGIVIADSYTRVTNLFVGTIHIEDKLCVDEVCISKDQLKAMIIKATATTTEQTSTTTPLVSTTTQVLSSPIIPDETTIATPTTIIEITEMSTSTVATSTDLILDPKPLIEENSTSSPMVPVAPELVTPVSITEQIEVPPVSDTIVTPEIIPTDDVEQK